VKAFRQTGIGMRKTLLFVVLVAAAASHASAGQNRARTAEIPNDPAAVEHALNRLAYGPRPGEVDRVRQIGLGAWIEQQLNPSAIDDSALAARLPQIPSPPETATQQELQRFGRQQIQTLAAQKVQRAIYSERQLEEVMVDFWFNHFNVFAGKGRTGLFLPSYERDAIRPHVWGRFRDLLGATAKSPAMLFYLDNHLSVDPQAAELAANAARRRQANGDVQQPPAAQRRRGLNENYARELLELHTLGVDGGYTQKDIVEVARALTGWTIAQPGRGRQGAPARRAARRAGGQQPPQDQAMMLAGVGTFTFTPRLHDAREKVVLGTTLKAGGGIDDGERVLDIVAAHPSTARHIATKLVRRFVSDNPPDALVARVAARFTETDGNLREVVRAVITSPEFFAAQHRGTKTKTPLEFVVSAVRVTGREAPDGRRVVNALQQLGMMPYMCQPPTGYDDEPETWINAGALVTRVNIAQQIAPAQAARIGGPEFQRR
jgi:uncharacterized protein (DUF1800 family)